MYQEIIVGCGIAILVIFGLVVFVAEFHRPGRSCGGGE